MDRETALEIGVGVIGVGGFILAMLIVGTMFGNGALNSQGGIAMIAIICGFIVLMTGMGYMLSRSRS